MNTNGRLFALTLLALIFASTTVAQTSSSLAGLSTTKTNPDAATSPEDKSGIADPLLRVLVAKGLLTTAEARSVTTGSVVEQRDRLAALLRDALLFDRLQPLKEWAYAGFTFDLIGAAWSHLASRDPFYVALVPIGFLVVMVISYVSWKQLQRVSVTDTTGKE